MYDIFAAAASRPGTSHHIRDVFEKGTKEDKLRLMADMHMASAALVMDRPPVCIQADCELAELFTKMADGETTLSPDQYSRLCRAARGYIRTEVNARAVIEFVAQIEAKV